MYFINCNKDTLFIYLLLARPRSPASVARSKVEKQRSQQKPLVSSPIDTYRLELELTNHPDHSFVFNLLSTLKKGARIGYSGPRSDRVSPNLISGVQHPDVVSLNLQKEVALGRVAGPYQSPPLPKFQCHPVGVVPKKTFNGLAHYLPPLLPPGR